MEWKRYRKSTPENCNREFSGLQGTYSNLAPRSSHPYKTEFARNELRTALGESISLTCTRGDKRFPLE